MLYVGNGRISHKQAVEKAYQEYDIFNKTQPIESDFDKIVKGLAKKKIITFPDYVIMIQLWKIVFYESNKYEFYELVFVYLRHSFLYTNFLV